MPKKSIDLLFYLIHQLLLFLTAPAIEEDLISVATGREWNSWNLSCTLLFPVLEACRFFSHFSFTAFDFCWNGARVNGKVLHISWSVFIWSVKKILEKFPSPAAEKWLCEPRQPKLICYCRGLWKLVEIKLSHDISQIKTLCECEYVCSIWWSVEKQQISFFIPCYRLWPHSDAENVTPAFIILSTKLKLVNRGSSWGK